MISCARDPSEGWVAVWGDMGPENRDQGPMQQVTCPGGRRWRRRAAGMSDSGPSYDSWVME